MYITYLAQHIYLASNVTNFLPIFSLFFYDIKLFDKDQNTIIDAYTADYFTKKNQETPKKQQRK